MCTNAGGNEIGPHAKQQWNSTQTVSQETNSARNMLNTGACANAAYLLTKANAKNTITLIQPTINQCMHQREVLFNCKAPRINQS